MPCFSQNIPECIDRERLSIEVPFLGSTLLIESNDFIKMRWDFGQLAQAALFIDHDKAAELIEKHEKQQTKTSEAQRSMFTRIFRRDYAFEITQLVFEKLKGFEFSDKGRNFVFSKCDFVNESALFYFETKQIGYSRCIFQLTNW